MYEVLLRYKSILVDTEIGGFVCVRLCMCICMCMCVCVLFFIFFFSFPFVLLHWFRVGTVVPHYCCTTVGSLLVSLTSLLSGFFFCRVFGTSLRR